MFFFLILAFIPPISDVSFSQTEQDRVITLSDHHSSTLQWGIFPPNVKMTTFLTIAEALNLPPDLRHRTLVRLRPSHRNYHEPFTVHGSWVAAGSSSSLLAFPCSPLISVLTKFITLKRVIKRIRSYSYLRHFRDIRSGLRQRGNFPARGWKPYTATARQRRTWS